MEENKENIKDNQPEVNNIESKPKKRKKIAIICSLLAVVLAVVVTVVGVLICFLNKPQEELNVFSKGLVAVRTEDGWGYINKKGELVIMPQFEEAYPFSDNGLALVCLDGFYGFINTKGKYEVNPIYSEAKSFENGSDLTVVKRKNKYGFVNNDGEEKIVCQFEFASQFVEDLALVQIGGKYGFIDKKGNFVINPQYDNAESFNENGLTVVSQVVESEKKCGIINTKGDMLTNFEFDKILIGEENIITFDGENYSFKDLKMKELFNTKNEIANFKISLDSFKNIDEQLIPYRDVTTFKYGFLNLNGQPAIEAKYDIIGNFNDGLAKVKSEGKYGFIDKNGNYIVNNVYDFAEDYSNGYAVVSKGVLDGLIDSTGKIVMDNNYEFLSNVNNDIICYKTTDKSTYGYYNVKEDSYLGAQQYSEVASGHVLYSCSDDGYIVVKQGEYFGIINNKGEFIINPYLLEINF